MKKWLLAALIMALTACAALAEQTVFDFEDASLKNTFDVVYEAGTYLSGQDIDPDTYVIIIDVDLQQNGGNIAYFKVMNDLDGSIYDDDPQEDASDFFFSRTMLDMKGNYDAPSGFTGAVTTVAVQPGQYLALERCYAVREEEFYQKYRIQVPDDYLLQCYDEEYDIRIGAYFGIPAGRYTIYALQDDKLSHSFSTYKNAKRDINLMKMRIPSQNVTDPVAVELYDGEVLELNGCNIDLTSYEPIQEEQPSATLRLGPFVLALPEGWTVSESEEGSKNVIMMDLYEGHFARAEFVDLNNVLSPQHQDAASIRKMFEGLAETFGVEAGQVFDKQLQSGMSALCCFPVNEIGKVNYLVGVFEGTSMLVIDFAPYDGDAYAFAKVLNNISIAE